MIANSPSACDVLFGERVNRGDLEGVLSLYEASATLVGPDDTCASGLAAIRAALEAAPLRDARIDMKVTREISGGDDIALLFNDWTLQATAEDGSPVHLSFAAIEVVRRQADGSWKFVIDHPYAIPK